MTQATFIQNGNVIDYTSPIDVAPGNLVVLGDLVGIAQYGLTANVAGSVAVTGVFDLPKSVGDDHAIGAGAEVFWHEAYRAARKSPHDQDAINDPSLTDDTSATTVDVVHGERFQVGDIFRAEGSQELIRVTAVNGDALTVVRGHDGTTAAALNDGDTLLIMNKGKRMGHATLAAAADAPTVRVRLSA